MHVARNLEDEIVTRLYTGSRKVVDLVEEIVYLRKVSVQGVYKALRMLRAEEIIIVHNHTASLSLVWLEKERERIVFAEDSYKSTAYLEELQVGKRTRIRSIFRTLNEIDLFWTHAYLSLAERVTYDIQTYSVQPHDWYMYVRSDTDSFWIKKHRESGRISRTLLTHSAHLDRVVMRERKKQLGDLFEYTLNENPLRQDSSTYYNILGSFIFTAHFDQNVSRLLDTFTEANEKLPLSTEEQKKIETIVGTKGTFVLEIEHNERRAETMTKKVKKYFEF